MKNIWPCIIFFTLLSYCKPKTSKELPQSSLGLNDHNSEVSRLKDTFHSSKNGHQNIINCSESHADSLFSFSITLERRKVNYKVLNQNLEHSIFSVVKDAELKKIFKHKPLDIIEEEINFDLPESSESYQKLLKINTKSLQDINTEIVYSTNINVQSKEFNCGIAALSLPDTLGMNSDFMLFKCLQGVAPPHCLHIFNKHIYRVPWRVYSIKNFKGDHIIILAFYTPGAIGSMLLYDNLLIYDINSKSVIYSNL